MRTLLGRYLPTKGWQVSTAGDGLSALQAIDAQRFDAVLADARLPGPSGVKVLEYARGALPPGVTLILFSGWLTQDDRKRAADIGALTVSKGAVDSLGLLTTLLEHA